MAYARTATVKALLAKAPTAIVQNILVGAGRAAAKVVAKEAAERCISEDARSAIHTQSGTRDGKVVAKVIVKGPGAYIGVWLEYGTSPHFISVHDEQRGGLSVNKVNQRVAEGSLVIGGKFVGATVHHPGAKPHPFLRVSFDMKEGEALAAAQAYIDTRIANAGLFASPPAEDVE